MQNVSFTVFLPTILAAAGAAQAAAPATVLASFPGSVHGALAFTEGGTLLEVDRAQVTVYVPDERPWSTSADGAYVGAGSHPSLHALRQGPEGLWAVFAPDVGIPRNRQGRPETPTWRLPQGEVVWTADPERCWVPLGAERASWLAALTTTVDCQEPVALERVDLDGTRHGPIELPPGFRLEGHDTRQLPVAAMGTDVVWAIAGGALWRHDGQWTVPFAGDFTHVTAQGDRVLAVRAPGGWSLRTSSGQELASGDEPVLRAVFSEDGRWLAVGLKDALRVLDAETGQERVPPRPGRHQAPHAFSTKGDLLAVAIGGRPTVLGFDGATLPTAERVRFRGEGLVSRTEGDLTCRGSITAAVSGPTARRIDAHHGIFPPVESPVIDGVARFEDVPCGTWRVASSDFVDVRVGAGETRARTDASAITVAGADGRPVEGALVRFVDREGAREPLGRTDANGQVQASFGPFGLLTAETEDQVGSIRSGAPHRTIDLVPKLSQWRVRATDPAGQPVAGVAIAVTPPAELDREPGPDFAVTNDDGEAWLPSPMRAPTIRLRPGGLAEVDDDGVFRVSTGRLSFDPVDDGLELLFVDALGVALPAGATQGKPRRALQALPDGPGRLEAWRGDACATVAVEGDTVTPPEPDTSRAVTIDVRHEDGRPVAAAEIWRAAPADPGAPRGPRATADAQGRAEVPVCTDADLVAAADPDTGWWGLAVGPGPVVVRFEPTLRPAVVLGAGGVVAEPAPALGLRRFDRVVRWGRQRTEDWTADDAALAVWGASAPVKVKVVEREGGKDTLVVPPPTP